MTEEQSTLTGYEKAEAIRTSPEFLAIVKKHKLKHYVELADFKSKDRLVFAGQKEAVECDLIAANILYSLYDYSVAIYGYRLVING